MFWGVVKMLYTYMCLNSSGHIFFQIYFKSGMDIHLCNLFDMFVEQNNQNILTLILGILNVGFWAPKKVGKAPNAYMHITLYDVTRWIF